MIMMMKWLWHYCQGWESSDVEPGYAVIREIYRNPTLDWSICYKTKQVKNRLCPRGKNTELVRKRICLLALGFYKILCYLQHYKKKNLGSRIKGHRADFPGDGRQLMCVLSSWNKSEVSFALAVTEAMTKLEQVQDSVRRKKWGQRR